MRSTPGDGVRSNALWGRGGRIRGRLPRVGRAAFLLSLVTALAIPAAGVAANGGPALAGSTGRNGPRNAPDPERFGGSNGPVVADALIAQAQANPNATFRVIVQGKRGERSGDVASEVGSQNGR